ncbi:hypothetical protein ACG2QI_00205 [Bacillus sp. GM2]|uniref:Uncharacterized protein n=2 Tax=Bacillus subtilis group TaxID=653685 RepID=A0A8B5YCZ1_BACLI|nr:MULTISPECIES: hypothetical protein [Bacillus subtilis group]ARC72434.1 hypothetical protein B37_00379 [Bacillus licheniformis]ARW41569.1 hypothetical protein S100141_00244 [Bacillus licheniformis]ARW53044.1 hypothetical protein S100027_01045 [Bacillus licheniformis]ASB87711.1 hypothetical protein S101395_01175 [Bacillus sonorensis]AXF87701.1 hypothetical protein BLDA23_05175 [Bacillus licheniformis]
MDTLDQIIKKQNDPMEKRRQLAMLKTGMRGVAGTKLESVRNTLRPKFKVDDIQKEMNSVYSSLLYSFEGKAQQALAQRISQSAQQLIHTEQDGESFVNGFKTN